MKTFHYVSHLTPDHIKSYKEISHFPKSVLTFLSEDNTYPVIEAIDKYELFALFLPIYHPTSQYVSLSEINIIISQKEIFLMSIEPQEVIDKIGNRVLRSKKVDIPTTYKLILELCTYILNQIIALEKVIDNLRKETIEEEGYTESTINTIMKLRLSIGLFRSTIDPLIDIINHIFNTIDYSDNDNKSHHKNQIDYLVKQIHSQSTFLYDTVSIVADTSNTIQNINANTIMKILTIISSVFIPLSFVTGFFGMNFTDLPINNTTFYYSMIFMMVFIGSFQLYVFKRKKRF